MKVIRCYAQCLEPNLWEMYSVEFGLAARGSSFDSAKKAMQAQIDDYVAYLLKEEDPAQRKQLLARKAPLEIRLTYYAVMLLCKVQLFVKNNNNAATRMPKHIGLTLDQVIA